MIFRLAISYMKVACLAETSLTPILVFITLFLWQAQPVLQHQKSDSDFMEKQSGLSADVYLLAHQQ